MDHEEASRRAWSTKTLEKEGGGLKIRTTTKINNNKDSVQDHVWITEKVRQMEVSVLLFGEAKGSKAQGTRRVQN